MIFSAPCKGILQVTLDTTIAVMASRGHWTSMGEMDKVTNEFDACAGCPALPKMLLWPW